MEPTEGRERPVLSIVFPAYNEADSIQRGNLQRLEEYLSQQPYGSEVIVVDDGSTDATVALVEECARESARLTLIRNEHRGKAFAVTTGVLAAEGDYVLFMDMDLATSLEHIGQFLTTLQRGDADVVTASREARGAVRLDAPWTRRLMGKTFNLLVQALLLPGLWDTQCGFKAFRREVAQDLFNSLVIFALDQEIQEPRVTAFDVELLVLARRRGYRIKELPVTWRHHRTHRVNVVRDSYRMLREVLLVWFNDRRGKYHAARD